MLLQPKMLPILRTFIFIYAVYAVSINGEQTKCRSAKDCHIFHYTTYDIEAKCDEGVCRCSIDRRPIQCQEKTPDMSDIVFGPCPCAMPFSECKNGLCYCVEGLKPSRDMRRCIPSALAIGQKCQNDEQCQTLEAFTVCSNSSSSSGKAECRCQHGYSRFDNGKCRAIVNERENCHTNYDCTRAYTNRSQCDFNIFRCVCREDFVKNSHVKGCLRGSNWAHPCKIDAQCQRVLGIGGHCVNEICHCRQPYLMRWQKQPELKGCALPTDLGDVCASSMDCENVWQKNQTLHCSSQRCKCKYGYVSKTNITCRISRGSALHVHSGIVYSSTSFSILTFLYLFII